MKIGALQATLDLGILELSPRTGVTKCCE